MGSFHDISDFLGKRIVILAGGESSEREISFRSAQNVQRALRNLGIEAEILILLGRTLKSSPRSPDLAFIMMHGKPGEDGTVQDFWRP